MSSAYKTSLLPGDRFLFDRCKRSAPRIDSCSTPETTGEVSEDALL